MTQQSTTPHSLCKLYALTDSDGEARYIGKTRQQLATRLRGHMDEARRSPATYHKLQWIRSLNYTPGIIELAIVPNDQASEYEKLFIKLFRLAGHDLTNTTIGGDGGWSDAARAAIKRGPLSEITKRKISEAQIGKVVRGETRERIRNARAAQQIIISDQTKAKISASLMGHSVSEESKKRMRKPHRRSASVSCIKCHRETVVTALPSHLRKCLT